MFLFVFRILYYTQITKKVKKLHDDGFKIVFISNQVGQGDGSFLTQQIVAHSGSVGSVLDWGLKS